MPYVLSKKTIKADKANSMDGVKPRGIRGLLKDNRDSVGK
jgi:hypothetical protein